MKRWAFTRKTIAGVLIFVAAVAIAVVLWPSSDSQNGTSVKPSSFPFPNPDSSQGAFQAETFVVSQLGDALLAASSAQKQEIFSLALNQVRNNPAFSQMVLTTDSVSNPTTLAASYHNTCVFLSLYSQSGPVQKPNASSVAGICQ